MKAETDRHQVSSEVAGIGSATSSVEQTWRIPQKVENLELCAHMRSPEEKSEFSDKASKRLMTYHGSNKNDYNSIPILSDQ